MYIVQLPDPVLRLPAKPVNVITPKIIDLVCKMAKTLRDQDDPPGVGLAAPQVGESLQIFLIYPPVEKASKSRGAIRDIPTMKLFINPKIIESKGEYKAPKGNENLEGCLSLHGYYGPVKRAGEVTVEFDTFDIDSICRGAPVLRQPEGVFAPSSTHHLTQTFTGFPAVIIQHEFDHLQGKIFVDRVLEQKGKLYKVSKDSKGKEVLDEVNI